MSGGPDWSAPVLDARGLTFRYPGAADPAISDLDISMASGEFFGVLGPNGSGKSTLVRLLFGARRSVAGTVRYRGRAVSEWDRRELALRVAVVPQIEEHPFPLTVREMVAMGRYPHLGRWRSETVADREAVERAMRTADVLELARRPFDTLSGGERQRTRIARALAQDPETLVLDEPTAALDIRHEMEIFELLGTLATTGVAILLVTHNLNLAARYSDRVLLLDRGHAAGTGTPGEVLTAATIEAVYGWPVSVVLEPGPGGPTSIPRIHPVSGR